jgi:hypothetical protein
MGGGDLEDDGSKPAWAKILQDLISTNKPDMVVNMCNFNYARSIGRIIVV